MKRKLLSVITVLALVLGLCPTWALAAETSGTVSYRDWDGSALVDKSYDGTYNTVEAGTVTWNGGWYVVSGDVTISSRIAVNGDVRLILTDGCTLNANKGVEVPSGSGLTIYGQTGGAGTLIANADEDYAGIGGSRNGSCGTITINGGTVEATGGGGTNGAAGIGSAYLQNIKGSTVTINGGTVRATGGGEYGGGAGIGGARLSSNDTVTINGGTVTATGGGAMGGAGIGSGGYEGSTNNTVTINGGTVTATGGGSGVGGAGIGGGCGGSTNNTVTINGGEVTATGGLFSDGIGNSKSSSNVAVTITGGTVTAKKGGGSDGKDITDDKTITGGTVNGTTYYTVTFLNNRAGVAEVPPQTLVSGEKATEPDPRALNEYIRTWYTDQALTNRFSFDTPITEKLTLYAKWERTTDYIVSVTQPYPAGGVETKQYTSLSAAWASLQNQTSTLKVLKNVTTSQTLEVSAGMNVTVKMKENVTLTNNSADCFKVDGGTLTLTGGTVVENSSGKSVVYAASGTLNVEGGTYRSENGNCLYVEEGVQVQLSGGTLHASDKALRYGNRTVKEMLKAGHAIFDGSDRLLLSRLNGTELAGNSNSYTVAACGTHDLRYTDQNNGTHIHMCIYCGYSDTQAEAHSYDDNGKCTACGAEAVAKVAEGSSSAVYYETLREAWNAGSGKTCTITLLKDANCSATDAEILTVNTDMNVTVEMENGATLTAGEKNCFHVNGGTLTLTESCNVVKGGTRNSVVSASSGALYIQGGNYQGNWNGLWIDKGVTVQLTGGTFTVQNILLRYQSPKTAGAMLAEGYGLFDSSGNRVTSGLDQESFSGSNRTYTVEKLIPSLKNAVVEFNGSVTYNGQTQKPTVSVTLGDSQLAEGRDYTVRYTNESGQNVDNPTDAGTYTVIIDSANTDKYTGQTTAEFTIKPKMLTPAIDVTNGATKVYDGTDTAPGGLSITLTGIENNDNVSAKADSYTYNSADVDTATTITANNIRLSGDKAGNYVLSDTTATIAGTITKAAVTITWASTPQSVDYSGKPAEITAPDISAQGGVAVSVAPDYAYEAQGSGGFVDGLPTNAGTYTVRASIAESVNLTAAEATIALTIEPVALTISGAAVTPKTYDGTDAAAITDVTFSGLVNGETLGAADYTVTGEFDSADAGKNKNVTITVALADTDTAKNYIISGTYQTTGEIKKAGTSIATAPTASGITYGQALSASALTGGGAVSGENRIEGTWNWTVPATKPNAGTTDHAVTFTPTNLNYDAATVDVSVTVAKAVPTLTAPTASAIQYGQKLSDSTLTGGSAANPCDSSVAVAGSWNWANKTEQPTETGSFTAVFTLADTKNYETPANVDVSVVVGAATPELTVSAPDYQIAGREVAVAYTVANPHDAALADLPAVTLTYKVGDGEVQPITNGKFTIPSGTASGTLVTITATTAAVDGKYAEATKTVTVAVTDKTPVEISGVSVIGRAYNGKAVNYTGTPVIKTLDGAAVTDAQVTYTWSGGTAPVNAGSYTLTISVGGEKYIGSTTVDFTIKKATVTITAANKSVVVGSMKPELTYTVSGLADGEELTTKPTLDCTPDMNTAGNYPITASGAAVPNASNYNTTITYVDGTLSVTAKPSTGGGYVPSDPGGSSLPVTTTGQGSTTTTTTTTAAPTASVSNGTVTTTINTAMGNEIVKQAVANKSEEVVIAPNVTGSVTKAEVSIPASTVGQIGSQTNASLTVSTPVADVTIPNGGLGSLSSAGGAVTVTAQQTGNSVELTVTAGGRTVQNVPGGVTLTVPAENTTPGTVAVLVHEDGAREVVRKSVAEDGSITIPLEGSAKLEIVDNSKRFDDVPATGWVAEAAAFVSSHELFQGTAPGRFSPDAPMSRGMLAVVLHNLENNPTQALTGAFADVSSGQWYAEGVAWAAAQGIVDGYGNGQFGPGDSITREQLAVMLWRYAGSPAATDRELHFADADKASGWAEEALCWAVENGILNGKGGGVLDPTGQATRAEAARMLMKFMEKR